MRAIVVHEGGGPEVLKYEDVPEPTPGQVLVRVSAASLNFASFLTVRVNTTSEPTGGFGAVWAQAELQKVLANYENIGTFIFVLQALMLVPYIIIGVMGVMVRRNIIIIFMSIELILNAVNINLVAFSAFLNDIVGQIFALPRFGITQQRLDLFFGQRLDHIA